MCRLRFWWVAIALVLALASGAWWTWKGRRPQLKQYIPKDSKWRKTLSHSGVKFAYSADFQVHEIEGSELTELRLTHIPTAGVAAWVEEHLHKDQATGWNKATIEISYSDIGIYRVEDLEYMNKKVGVGGRSARRVRYHIGAGVAHDGLTGDDSEHLICLIPESARTIGAARSSGAVITVFYNSADAIEPQMRRVVDEIASSMQIVPVQ
jgi:hypothetical protein